MQQFYVLRKDSSLAGPVRPHLPISLSTAATLWGQQTFTEVTTKCGEKNNPATQARKHIWNPSQTGQQPDVHDQNSHYLPKVVSVLPIV